MSPSNPVQPLNKKPGVDVCRDSEIPPTGELNAPIFGVPALEFSYY